jgi:hypothetical protein
MFGYNRVNIRRRATIVLALIAVMVCIVDVQLYFEHQVLAHTVTCTIKLNQQGDYFNMSIRELMNVVVV